MGLQRFERRLERLVEGAFTKAFRSGLQPVEIGRRVWCASSTPAARSACAARSCPTTFTVWLSPEDSNASPVSPTRSQRELQDAVREHARDEGYHFVGPVEVLIERRRAPRSAAT